MLEPVGQSEPAEPAAGVGVRVVAARTGREERKLHVLEGGQPRNQAEALEDDPHACALIVGATRERSLDRAALPLDDAGVLPVEPGEQPEQGALAGPGRPHQHEEIARRDRDRDLAERERPGRTGERADQIHPGEQRRALAGRFLPKGGLVPRGVRRGE